MILDALRHKYHITIHINMYTYVRILDILVLAIKILDSVSML